MGGWSSIFFQFLARSSGLLAGLWVWGWVFEGQVDGAWHFRLKAKGYTGLKF